MTEEQSSSNKELFPWHLGVFDAHCHPTDTVPSIENIASMKTRALVIMATRGQDQSIVADFADKLGFTMDSVPVLKSTESNEKPRGFLLPSFGWHPWFSHQIYDDRFNSSDNPRTVSKIDHYRKAISPTPKDDDFMDSLLEPRPLSDLLNQTRSFLERFPLALVGEIGLDRAFRIPGREMVDNDYEKELNLTPGGREGRRLSPYRVDMEHQRIILKAQLNLAGEMQRAVSVHGVAAHGIVFETLQETWRGLEKPVLSKRQRKGRVSVDTARQSEQEAKAETEPRTSQAGTPKPFPPRICLHSYSGHPDTLKQYLHPAVPAVIFFSFSRLVNFSTTSSKAVAVIKAVPDDRILAESDLHAAGAKMDDLMEEIIVKICQIKGWSLENGVKQLSSNWMHYAFGGR